MNENRTDWEISKHKLELFQGDSRTEQLRSKLINLAENGIMHVHATLAHAASGEIKIGEVFNEDPSHDFNHAMRVLKLAENLSVIGGDIDVIRASVLFHDLITYSKDAPEAKTETREAALYAKDLLESIGFPKIKIEKTLYVIAKTSFSNRPKLERPESILTEEQIMYDADKLDQSGAIAIMRYFSSGGQMERKSFNPGDPFLEKTDREPEVLKYTLDALVDRLPKIVRSITIPAAAETAKQRNDFFYLFLKELKLELKESKKDASSQVFTGASDIIRLFEDAGRTGKIFYSHQDTFCEHRKPEPQTYPLDALIENHRTLLSNQPLTNGIKRRAEFIENYLIELKYELEGELVPPPRLKITREVWPGDEEDIEESPYT